MIFKIFNTIEWLCKTNQGFLRLNLAEFNNTNKSLDKINIDGKDYFITGGTYITPLVCSLLQGKIASGIMLDTTWHLLQYYVCWTSYRTHIQPFRRRFNIQVLF